MLLQVEEPSKCCVRETTKILALIENKDNLSLVKDNEDLTIKNELLIGNKDTMEFPLAAEIWHKDNVVIKMYRVSCLLSSHSYGYW